MAAARKARHQKRGMASVNTITQTRRTQAIPCKSLFLKWLRWPLQLPFSDHFTARLVELGGVENFLTKVLPSAREFVYLSQHARCQVVGIARTLVY
jgi:hypothetical protein